MDRQSLLRQRAREQYRKLHLRAVQRKLWAALTGRPHRLLRLHDVHLQPHQNPGQMRRYGGLHLVPLAQIRGSEGRSRDFDADFRPLKPYDEERWVQIAVAYQLGLGLPPVELVQVGDSYFVRDGHHRVSVAKLLGQEAIEAEVTVWEGAETVGASPPRRNRWQEIRAWLMALPAKWRASPTPPPCLPAPSPWAVRWPVITAAQRDRRARPIGPRRKQASSPARSDGARRACSPGCRPCPRARARRTPAAGYGPGSARRQSRCGAESA